MKKRKDIKRMSTAMIKVKSPLKNGEGDDKKEKYRKNTEFNKYAMKKGISPNFDAMPDSVQLKAMEKFYGNPANVKMMNKAQSEYFKNKR